MYRQASSAKLENLNARKCNKKKTESDKMNSTMADETSRRRDGEEGKQEEEVE